MQNCFAAGQPSQPTNCAAHCFPTLHNNTASATDSAMAFIVHSTRGKSVNYRFKIPEWLKYRRQNTGNAVCFCLQITGSCCTKIPDSSVKIPARRYFTFRPVFSSSLRCSDAACDDHTRAGPAMLLTRGGRWGVSRRRCTSVQHSARATAKHLDIEENTGPSKYRNLNEFIIPTVLHFFPKYRLRYFGSGILTELKIPETKYRGRYFGKKKQNSRYFKLI